ncbi:MAG: glycosyltransferase [Coxiellaceae bacterium]|nr:glycosyltransferase [Coxiellaceae bacterium]MDP1950529.1 glycosyltransferase [Nitrosomonas sp.]
MAAVACLALFGAIIWWSLLLVPWRPWSTREQIEADTKIKNAQLDDITVLIPARNEAPFIEQTLVALSKQGSGLRIIVVDDQSDDETAEQAKFYGAWVISGVTPPTGWSGKLWALEQGLHEVRTPYVLLLDADIELTPGIVATLRAKARKEKLALVSLMAELPLERFIERMLMPAFIFFFKLLYPFSLANKPTSRVAAAAGGCILVETQALRRIGAFAGLHDALIDDCTLATRIKQANLRIWVGLSHSARSQRGYDELKPIWEMVARTAYTQLNYSSVLLAICTLVMVCMFWIAPFAIFFLPDPTIFVIGLLTWAAMFLTYIPILVYYRRSLLWGFTLPIIGTLYLAMAWTSAIRYWQGERASWKDRRYESNTQN